MEELGKIHQLIITVFGYPITLNLELIVMTWIVVTMLLAFSATWPAGKRRSFRGLFRSWGNCSYPSSTF